jgi:5-methylcytosine-specific restriction endonuclease McrA
MARDDFSPSIIRKLRDRVNLRCSNPSCRVPTSAPSNTSNDAVNNTGIAAHICAASEGGPRYKAAMTSQERKAIDNAIWLCANCSIRIDRDEESYKEEILREWKYKAEETAKSEQGKRLPRKDDAVDMLTTALTGFPKRLIVDAIANAHRASEKSLEALDPRFEIKTTHNENGTYFKIRAKENVSIKMNIDKNYAEEFFYQFNGFVEHGEDVKIDACAIGFEKSPLLEELSSQMTNGILHFSPYKKILAVQKVWVRDQASNIVDTFDDFIGEIYAGTKSFTFKGGACKGLFNLTLKKELESIKNTVNIALSLSTRDWDQFDICLLPYFDKLLSFFSKLESVLNHI